MSHLGRFFLVLAAAAPLGCVSAATRDALDRSESAAARVIVTPRARTQEVEPDLSGPIDDEQIVALAVSRSPALAALAFDARSFVHAGRAEGSLPPPRVSLEIWNLPLERPYSLNEADMYMVELEQSFPPGGARNGRARAMAEEAEVMLAELAAEEALVVERVAREVIDYRRAVRERELEAEGLVLLAHLGAAARSRVSTGSASLAELARLDVERSRGERAIARLDGEVRSIVMRLNALLRRPAGAPLGIPAQREPMTVRLAVPDLAARASARRGATRVASARVRQATALREAAEAEARTPEFMVGGGYFQEPAMRPGFGLSLGMSLPWLWGPGAHLVSRAKDAESAERLREGSAEIDAASEIADVHARLRALEVEILAIEDTALPAAARAVQALTASYTTGAVSLLEWMDAARLRIDLELELARLEGQLQLSVIELERAVGAPLERVSLRTEKSP